jgi:hypothetical protein
MQRKTTSLILTVLFTILLSLTMILSYTLAFAQPLSSSSQPRQQIGSSLSSLCIHQQQISPQNGSSINSPGLIGNGSINSVLNLPKGLKYIANGYWDLFDDGRFANFTVQMTWYPNTPTNSSAAKVHTHAIKDFQLLPGQIVSVQPNNIRIKGCADVLTSGKVTWPNIPISIKIVGNTIDVSFTGNDQYSTSARNHFAEQDTTGVVKALAECGGPQPGMVVLPDCNDVPLSSQSSTTIKTPSGSNNGVVPFIPNNPSGGNNALLAPTPIQ